MSVVKSTEKKLFFWKFSNYISKTLQKSSKAEVFPLRKLWIFIKIVNWEHQPPFKELWAFLGTLKILYRYHAYHIWYVLETSSYIVGEQLFLLQFLVGCYFLSYCVSSLEKCHMVSRPNLIQRTNFRYMALANLLDQWRWLACKESFETIVNAINKNQS